jgi:chromosome segregation ATPase
MFTDRTLYIVSAIAALVFILLGTLSTFYGVKFKRMERMYQQEMAERKRLATELRETKTKLQAKENEVEILNKALDELKSRVRTLELERSKTQRDKTDIPR